MMAVHVQPRSSRIVYMGGLVAEGSFFFLTSKTEEEEES